MMHIGAGMTRRGFCGAGLAAIALGAGRTLGAGLVPPRVKIGLVESLFRDVPEVLVMFAMAPFKKYLEDQMAVSSELSNGGKAVELGRKLKDEEVHLGVFHGVEFAWAQQRYPKLSPLFIAVNGDPVLHAHLIVRTASPFKTVASLAGKRVATPGRGREHCNLFLERRCTRPGVAPAKYFSKVYRSGDADDVLSSLGKSECHAALVDGIDWEGYKRDNPDKAARLVPLVSSEPFPCALLAHYGDHLDADMLAKFRIGMLRAKRSPKGKDMLKVMRITGFENVPADFDEQLASAAKAYPLQVK